MKDLEKIGLQRENLDKVGYRVGHYLDKIAAIDTQISELQAQAPYSDMFKEEVFQLNLFFMYRCHQHLVLVLLQGQAVCKA